MGGTVFILNFYLLYNSGERILRKVGYIKNTNLVRFVKINELHAFKQTSVQAQYS